MFYFSKVLPTFVVFGLLQGQITLMDVRVFKAIQPEVSGYQLNEERNVWQFYLVISFASV